jgi:RNA polymerase sigma-70 factor (ECF subfamily)
MTERFGESTKPTGFDHEDKSAAVEALVQLGAEERELVVMRIWGNLTYEEIGAALNVSTATAYRQYERALTKLRNILESPCTTSKNHGNTN